MDFSKVSFLTSAVNERTCPQTGLGEIALAGRSNVGKSSLLNMLVNRKNIAKVSKTPGRTQLINFFKLGEEACLVDLPGYGFANVPVEVQRQWGPMIQGYLTRRENLAGLLLLLDVRRDPGKEDLMMLEWLQERQLPTLIVLTKIDKLSRNESFNRSHKIAKQLKLPFSCFIPTSSANGSGRDELRQAIEELVAVYHGTSEGDESFLENS